jgi:hypothetical protein
LIAGVIAWLCREDPLEAESRSGGGGGGSSGYSGKGGNADDAAGAILVFLPGTEEIRNVEKALMEQPFASEMRGKALVLQLHGSLSMEEHGARFWNASAPWIPPPTINSAMLWG